MFKKIILFILPILLTLYDVDISASTTDIKEKEKSYLLHPDGHWDLSSDALYLQPGNLFDGNHELETLYDWGFSLDIKYHLSKDKHVSVRWLRFKTAQDNLSKRVADFQNEGPTTFNYRYNSRFDIIFAELSQRFPLRNKLTLYIHGGFTYSTQQIIQSAHAVSNITRFTETNANSLSFFGSGAVFGVNFTYPLKQNLNLLFNNWVGMQTRNATVRNRVVTNGRASEVDDKLFGAIATSTGFFGLDYNKKIKDGYLHMNTGWITVQYDETYAQWAGAFFGARWVGG